MRSYALEIARVARGALRDPSEYASVKVVFSWTRGVGIRLTRTRSFVFKTADLTPLTS